MTRRSAVFAIAAGLALTLSLGSSRFWPNALTGSPRPAGAPQQAAAQGQTASTGLTLPLKSGSVRFAVIGDSGTGKEEQYQVAQQMVSYRQSFPFDFVIMLGDNLYGGDSPSDYQDKFEQPYKALLDGGVKFYASLGNHDNPNERFYRPFNMGGQRYYTFKKGSVRFFALDSNYMDEQQINWLEQQLGGADSPWKICFFHHPLYSDGKFHGPDLDLRKRLEPSLEKYGVNLVLSGHEHVYERIAPQNGIYYFVLGNSGQLRYHNLRPSSEMEKGFDTDRDFMLVEIAGDELYFQTISRTGDTVDSGVVTRQTHAKSAHLGHVRQDWPAMGGAEIFHLLSPAQNTSTDS